MKRIIFNADDFGGSDFIDNGIIKAIKAEMVNSVSVLVNFMDSKERVQNNLLPLLKEHDVKIGLHLSITSGFAHKKYNTLTIVNSKEWEFPFMKNIRLYVIDKQELKEEIHYQINTLAEFLGGIDQIEHLNHHHGIFYFHPVLLEVLLETLEEIKTTTGKTFHLRSPLPWSKSGLIYYKYRRGMLPVKRTALSNVFSWASTKFGRDRWRTIFNLFEGTKLNSIEEVTLKLKQFGYQTSFCYTDQYYGQAKRHNLQKIIEHTPDDEIIELMLHLGDKDTARDFASGVNPKYYAGRAKELDVLFKNKEFFDEVKKVNYSPFSW